mgnify:CR=1 FL=1
MQVSLGTRRDLALSVALGAGSGGLLVLQAWLLAILIQRAFLGHDPLSDLWGAAAALAAVFTVRALLAGLSTRAAVRFAAQVKHVLRARLYDHLVALGPAFTRGERGGELSAVLTEGVEALDGYLAHYLPRLALAAAIPLMIAIFVLLVDPLSGLVLVVTGPLIPLFMWLIGQAAGVVARRRWGLLSRMSAYFLDVLQGLPTLKLFGRSRAQVAAIREVSRRYRDITLSVLSVAFLSALALEIVGTISTAIVAVEIGIRLLAGRMAFQESLFILVLAPEFYLPLRALGSAWHASTTGAEAARRIFAVLDTPMPARYSRQQAPRHPDAPYHIRFEQVTYCYPAGAGAAVEGISFEIKPGELVALVGPSGAGKSTLADLLMGVIGPDNGEVLVNGVPLAALDSEAWRTRIAWVPQRPTLFNTSIADNIRLGRPDATPDEVEWAARQAAAHEFITTLPDGYSTAVGEAGSRLSGGQRQRIALARAFLRDAPVLLLDEATANLDVIYEEQLAAAFSALVRGRTALVIAHRLHTISKADRVIVLEQGRLIEQGHHADLLRAGGAYARLLQAYGGGMS